MTSQVPLPRLQSIRTCSRPAGSKVRVYLAGSSGLRVVSSLPWNLTSRHEVPPSPAAVGCDAAAGGGMLSRLAEGCFGAGGNESQPRLIRRSGATAAEGGSSVDHAAAGGGIETGHWSRNQRRSPGPRATAAWWLLGGGRVRRGAGAFPAAASPRQGGGRWPRARRAPCLRPRSRGHRARGQRCDPRRRW
jgi:hypothetical protein